MVDLFKKKLQKSFSKSAQSYNAYALSQQKAGKELIASLLPHLSSLQTGCSKERISALEVGCGPQLLLHEQPLLLPSASLYGLDFSFQMLEEAKKRTKPRVSFVQGDMDALPFSDESIQLLLSSSTYQWGGGNSPLWLQEAGRVLKKRGLFAYTMMIAPSMKSFYTAWLQLFKTNTTLHEYPEQSMVQKETEKLFIPLEEKRIHLIQRYSSLKDFLKSIQKTGAVSPKSDKFTLTPQRYRTLEKALQNDEGNIDIDYHFSLSVLKRV